MTSLSTDCLFFFFNDTATTEIYTLSLHDALPIFPSGDRLTVTHSHLEGDTWHTSAQSFREHAAKRRGSDTKRAALARCYRRGVGTFALMHTTTRRVKPIGQRSSL